MKANSVIFILLFSLFHTVAFSQKNVTWKELTAAYHKEIYERTSDDKKKSTIYYKDFFLNKKFDENTISLKEIEGKEVTVRGYFLDLGADSMWYMVSRFTFENCFFCTGLGIETVIELSEYQNKNSKFSTDDIVIVTGKLYLVQEDDEYIYILKNCTVEFFES